MLRPLFLLTMKPTMYVANVNENGFRNNPLLEAVEAHAAKEGAPVVAICAALEAQIADMPEEDRKIFLADMGMQEPGLNRVIRAGYGLMAYRPTSPPGQRKCALGRSRSVPPRHRPPA